MEIRKNHDAFIKPTQPKRPIVDGDGDVQGIWRGGCIPPHTWPPIKLDGDRIEFSKKDKDKDGALSQEEFGTSRHHSLIFSRHDINNDGKLSLDEFKNGRDFDSKDKGFFGDQVLTSDEYGVGKKNQDEFRRYDTNHDGKVTREEFHAGRLWDKLKPPSFPKPFPMPRPLPMPLPDVPNGERPTPLPFPKPGFPKPPEVILDPVPVGRPIDRELGDLLSKVKAAQAEAK